MRPLLACVLLVAIGVTNVAASGEGEQDGSADVFRFLYNEIRDMHQEAGGLAANAAIPQYRATESLIRAYRVLESRYDSPQDLDITPYETDVIGYVDQQASSGAVYLGRSMLGNVTMGSGGGAGGTSGNNLLILDEDLLMALSISDPEDREAFLRLYPEARQQYDALVDWNPQDPLPSTLRAIPLDPLSEEDTGPDDNQRYWAGPEFAERFRGREVDSILQSMNIDTVISGDALFVPVDEEYRFEPYGLKELGPRFQLEFNHRSEVPMELRR